jgi:hypothetical protein
MAYNRLIPACLNLNYSLRPGFAGSLLLPLSQAPYQWQYLQAIPIAILCSHANCKTHSQKNG